MGDPIPDEWPELEDDLWYCVTVEVFTGMTEEPWCDENFQIADLKCCKEGWEIREFQDGWECVQWSELCHHSGYTSQRVKDITGGWATLEECVAGCFGI